MYFIRRFIFFIIVWVLCCSVQATITDDLLIPYHTGGKWGFCTPDATIRIQPQYDMMEYKYPYFFSVKEGHKEILDMQGRLVDSFDFVLGQLGEDSFLVLNYAPVHHTTDIFTGNETCQQYDTSFHLYLLHHHQLSRFAEGTTDAFMIIPPSMHQKMPNLFFLTENRKTGVYDIARRQYLVAPRYRHFKVLSGDVILAYNDDKEVRHMDGTALPTRPAYLEDNIISILDNGYYTRLSSGQDESKITSYNYQLDLLTSDGKAVIRKGQNMQVKPEYGLIVCEESKSKGSISFTLYNLEGKVLMNGIHDFREDFPDLLSLYGKGYDAFLGLFNYKTQKMVWENTYADTVRVKLLQDFIIPKIEVDTMTYFVNAQGEHLMALGKYNRYYEHVFRLMKSIKIFNPASGMSRRYTALRPSEQVPFTIYDENYEVVKGMEDFLGNFDSEVFAFKQGNLWGLADYDGIVLPAGYDSITFTKSYRNFHLYKDGQSQIYLRRARKFLPATGYDDAVGYDHHHFYIGIQYLDTLKRGQDHRYYKQLNCQVDLMDERGKIIYSFTRNPVFNIDYALTRTNQIIEYPEDNRHRHFYIHNTHTGEVKKIEKRFGGFESYRSMPVLVTFLSDHHTEIWNLNQGHLIKTLEEERRLYASQSVEFYNEKDTVRCMALTEMIETPNPDYMNMKTIQSMEDFERSSRRYNRTQKVMGYMNIEGTFYGAD